MLKRIIFIPGVLLFFILTSCHKDSGVGPFEYERDTPVWLKEKISDISSDTAQFYTKTKVYRYRWNESFIYHISIPLSSCVYCELYDENGNKVQITSDLMLQNFLNNRADEVLIWERKS